jgi:molybdate transport system substrate-binding protein
MRDVLRLFAMLCMMSVLPASAGAGQGITVFAAASLKGALDEVAAGYAGDVTLSYGGSGLLARQVAQGAPADVVLLANTAWMDWLLARDALAPGSRVDLLGNTLVLAAPQGAGKITQITVDRLLSRIDGGRLAMGQTRGVPAGIYGRQWLENKGYWAEISPHLAETENVRAALALVSRGEVPLAVVYGSDALADPGVMVAYEIPPKWHDEIIYPAAIVKGRNVAHAIEFVEYLRSNKAAEIFRAHGFLPLGDGS